MKVVILMCIALIGNITGFVREIVLARLYGASYISDVYVLAFTFPTIVFSMVGYGITMGYSPILNRLDEDKKGYFTNSVVNLLLIVSAFLIVVFFIFADKILYLVAPGLDLIANALAINYLSVSIFSIIFIGVSTIFTSLLNYNEKFYTTAIATIPISITIIVFLVISSFGSVKIIPYGILIGYIFQFVIILLGLRMIDYKYTFNINLTKEVKELVANVFPIFLTALLSQLIVIISINISSRFGEGMITMYNYSLRLFTIVEGLIIIVILNLLYPQLLKSLSENKLTVDSILIIRKYSVLMLSLLIPTITFIFVNSEIIINFLFSSTEFQRNEIEITSSILRILIIGILGYGLKELIVRIFYSLNNYKTPLFGSIVLVLSYIIFYLLFNDVVGSVMIVPSSLSFAYVFTLLFMIFYLYKNNMKFINFKLFKDILYILSVTVFAFLTSEFSIYLLQFKSDFLKLLVKGLTFLLVYLILIVAIKLNYLDNLNVSIIKNKFRNRKYN